MKAGGYPAVVAQWQSTGSLASSPGHSQILSRSGGEKLGEGLVPILCHGPEMVDSVRMWTRFWNYGNMPTQYVANTASDQIVKLA